MEQSQYGVKSPRLVSRLLLVLDLETEMKLLKICNLLNTNKTDAIKRAIQHFADSEEFKRLEELHEEEKLRLEDD